mgnify:CR=1 FL=1
MYSDLPTESPTSQRKSTGFRRVFAFMIDTILLFFIGFILGLIGKEFFSSLGLHGILIGWLIATLYFALFHSRYLAGQSIGKGLMGIEVVDKDGNHLSFGISFLRAIIFNSPYFLIEYLQGFSSNIVYFSILFSLSVAFYVGLFYFLIFNSDRRTVHDLLAGTAVKHTEDDMREFSLVSKSKIGAYVSIIVVVLLGFNTIYMKSYDVLSVFVEKFDLDFQLEGLESLAEDISELETVLDASVSQFNTTDSGLIVLTVKLRVRQEMTEESTRLLIKELREIMITYSETVSRLDYASIEINFGFDIGIARYSTKKEGTIVLEREVADDKYYEN